MTLSPPQWKRLFCSASWREWFVVAWTTMGRYRCLHTSCTKAQEGPDALCGFVMPCLRWHSNLPKHENVLTGFGLEVTYSTSAHGWPEQHSQVTWCNVCSCAHHINVLQLGLLCNFKSKKDLMWRFIKFLSRGMSCSWKPHVSARAVSVPAWK